MGNHNSKHLTYIDIHYIVKMPTKKSSKGRNVMAVQDHLLEGYGKQSINTPIHTSIPQRTSPRIWYMMYVGKDDLGDNLYANHNHSDLQQCIEYYKEKYPNIKNAHLLKNEVIAGNLLSTPPTVIPVGEYEEIPEKEMKPANKKEAARMPLIDKYDGAYVYDKYLDMVTPVSGIYIFRTGIKSEAGRDYFKIDYTVDLEASIKEYKKIYPNLYEVHFFACKNTKKAYDSIMDKLRRAGATVMTDIE